ncbi:Permease of the major facilitator superfamily [Candidatus Burkholderia verschuerenii]|uniref:Permease of the major facilitator superfamily n=1 Tax=Candidatus Burkholderia verschuerenii TaxID=242163 RepID=A0A0L0MIX7_9BURK|nr:MFS transporter [Candidatus Burkholderia verschuerenii]KND62246.1 Permease of the major facilitator superfamily [Candidatus Burkholderia verschuerenii]
MNGMNSNLSAHSPASRLSARQILTVTATSVGFVVSQLDVSIVNVALSSIGRDLHASVASLQWTVDSYALAFSALMLSAGSLGDRFGARRLFVGGLALFALASLLCAFSRDAAQLVAARAIQGVGAAAMLPNSLALLNAACGNERGVRARAVGLWTAAGSISIASGPIAGGLLIAAFGWRSIFWVNVPLLYVAGIAATCAWVDDVKPPRRRDRPAHAGGVDLPGQAFAIVALTAFVGSVIEMRPLGIAHPLVIGGIVLTCASAAAFIAIERRTPAPMLPLSLFSERTFSAATAFGIGVNLTYYGMVFVLSLYLQRVLGHTPLQTGLAFLPLTGGFLLSNLASGPLTARFGSRPPMILGALLDAAGFAALMFVGPSTPTVALLLPFLLIPSGMGVAVPAMTTALLGTVGQERAGTASAVLNTARQAAGAIGVAAFGALAGNVEAAEGAAIAQIVDAVRWSAGISVALLIVAALIARRVQNVTPKPTPDKSSRGTPATE